MISITNQRYESDGRECGEAISYDRTPSKAFTSFAKFELGYGGRLVDYRRDGCRATIVLRTDMMGRYDVVTFSGPLNEMEPMLKVLQYKIQLDNDKGLRQNAAENLFAVSKGNPLRVKMLSGFIVGASTRAAVALLLSGDIEEVERIAAMCDDTLYPIAELVLEGNNLSDAMLLA